MTSSGRRTRAPCAPPVSIRLWLPASIVGGVEFDLAYPVIAWLCWVPNILLAEWLFNRNQAASD